MYKKIAIAMFSIGMSTTYAGDTTNNCTQLHVQISNLTHHSCVLVNRSVIHGNLITTPPLSILPNDSKRFDIVQAGYGPSVTLSYQCGDETITFNSQQNACVFASGTITGIVMPPLPAHIKALHEAIEGSSFWDRPGMINWNLIGTA